MTARDERVRLHNLLCRLGLLYEAPRAAPSSDPALKMGARVSAAALEQGLIARAMPHGDILGFSSPLVLTPAKAEEIVAIARHAVDKVTDELAREGLRAASAI